MNILSFVTDVVLGPVTSLVKGWQDRKSAKLKSDLQVQEAKTQAMIDKISTGQKADIAWENTSIEQSSWKDEYWTLILSIPLIMCFIPGLLQYVQAGFEALNSTPPWYRWAIGIARLLIRLP